MATYVIASMTDPLNVEPEPRCDAHSVFDPDGFPLHAGDGKARAWEPNWGGKCAECGADC